MPDLTWKDPQPVDARPLDGLGLHPLAAEILVRRGVDDPDAARAFLDPAAVTLPPPAELPGLDEGAARIAAAIRNGERVLVWGDFDVDGQTSTTILTQTIRALGGDVIYHIPVRATESHGVKIPRLEEIVRQSAPRVLLTCDTGITAHEAVAWANAHGLDVVITDHHDPDETPPPALAVSDPKYLPVGHPFATLPGAGVAWLFAADLLRRFPNPPLAPEDLLDLAALGIVADVAELRGAARTLLQRGLLRLRQTPRLGLQTLYQNADILPDRLNEEHIGFRIAPRLNAIGRLGDARPVVELFTTQNPQRAQAIVQHLESLNAQRQMLTRQVLEGALAQLERDRTLADQPVLVLAHPDWPGGVLGLAAGQLAERFRKPVILLQTPPGAPARGSARSVPGVHITQAIAAQRDLLLGFGGHPQAAGLSLPAEHIPRFRQRLAQTVAAMQAAARVETALQLDAWLPWDAPSLELAAALETLAPFGNGHPPPLLATRNLQLESAVEIGRTREHLRLTVRDENDQTQTVLWWRGAGAEIPERFDLAYTLRLGDYRGQPQLNLTLVAMRESPRPQIEVKAQASYEILDWRNDLLTPADLKRKLTDWAETVIWAEGNDRAAAGGIGRDALSRAKTLVIWTPPPSRRALQDALTRVQPQRLVLCAHPLAAPAVKDFLKQVAGLAKFALNQRGGEAALDAFAAATAQRVSAIELALSWWMARGAFTFTCEGKRVHLEKTFVPNPPLADEILPALQTLLKETAAWRAFYVRAAPRDLGLSVREP